MPKEKREFGMQSGVLRAKQVVLDTQGDDARSALKGVLYRGCQHPILGERGVLELVRGFDEEARAKLRIKSLVKRTA